MVYQGIRLTPAEIVAAAVAEDVHLVGLSILSGSHLSLVPDVLDGLRAAGAGDVPVVVGGIIPEADAAVLLDLGVAAVFTPKDFAITDIMGEFVRLIRAAHGLDARPLSERRSGDAEGQETPVADSRRESAAAPSVPSSRR